MMIYILYIYIYIYIYTTPIYLWVYACIYVYIYIYVFVTYIKILFLHYFSTFRQKICLKQSHVYIHQAFRCIDIYIGDSFQM